MTDAEIIQEINKARDLGLRCGHVEGLIEAATHMLAISGTCSDRKTAKAFRDASLQLAQRAKIRSEELAAETRRLK